jgi:hypothetical protein
MAVQLDNLLRRMLDRYRRNQLNLAEVGVSGAWSMIHGLDDAQKHRAFQFATEAVAKYESLLDKPMMTYDTVWRFAYISRGEDLKRAYAANVLLSQNLERSGDVALWIVPTLVQFCFGAEIVRRQMWSDSGREAAYQIGRVASDKVGLLALGKTPLR